MFALGFRLISTLYHIFIFAFIVAWFVLRFDGVLVDLLLFGLCYQLLHRVDTPNTLSLGVWPPGCGISVLPYLLRQDFNCVIPLKNGRHGRPNPH